jgi:hypothetical protein
MTENILFDNIYVGHSLEDAQALAAESFKIKEKVEEEASRISEDKPADEPTKKTFKEDPLSFLRTKIADFVEAAKVSPIGALKAQPDVASAIALGFITLLGMLGTLFGVVGGAQAPVTKVGVTPANAVTSANQACSR